MQSYFIAVISCNFMLFSRIPSFQNHLGLNIYIYILMNMFSRIPINISRTGFSGCLHSKTSCGLRPLQTCPWQATCSLPLSCLGCSVSFLLVMSPASYCRLPSWNAACRSPSSPCSWQNLGSSHPCPPCWQDFPEPCVLHLRRES